MTRSVLVVAGEISGDMHAAQVVRALRSRDPELSFFGVGGDELRAAGMEIIHDVREMAVMGLAEVLRRYGFFRRVFREMVELARTRRPDAVILVDYPGFNLRFAAELKRMGIKVIYYVCPQVWAWHRSRIQLMARIVDRLIVIFPFEVDVFEGTGLKVDFVGHPLVDIANKIREEAPVALPWPGKLPVALLPGSRVQEVQRILPPMLGAAAILARRFADAGFLIAAPSEAIADLIRSMLKDADLKGARCEIVVGQTRQVLKQARAAMVASGTATIETALMDCPMVVVYRTSPITYWMARLLVQVEQIGMVNIVAGKELCPEFIQGEASPENIAAGMEPLLGETPERAQMVVGLEQVRQALGEGGCAERAADVIRDELRL